jgi:hypothetical protein
MLLGKFSGFTETEPVISPYSMDEIIYLHMQFDICSWRSCHGRFSRHPKLNKSPSLNSGEKPTLIKVLAKSRRLSIQFLGATFLGIKHARGSRKLNDEYKP